MKSLTVLLLLIAGLAWPARAAAQTTGDGPPRVSVGIGIGVSNPLHGDFDFAPLTWDAGVRVAMSRHALVEFAFTEWRHAPDASSAIGKRAHRAYGVNVLYSSSGRARVTAGGGVGLFHVDRPNFSSTTSAGQFVGGVDVDIAAGLAAFGQTRVVIPFRDPGIGDIRYTAGLRWGFGR